MSSGDVWEVDQRRVAAVGRERSGATSLRRREIAELQVNEAGRKAGVQP